MTASEAEAVLITGPFGTGKSSVAIEIADILEKRGVRYAVIDLDWLCWGYAGEEAGAEHRMMLANLRPVLANYLALGVRSVILARSLRSVAELESLRNVLPIRLRVVELVVSFQEIERRLGSDITAARGDDLEDARAWVTADDGTGFGDLSVTNDRPLREVADEIIQLLGWNA